MESEKYRTEQFLPIIREIQDRTVLNDNQRNTEQNSS